MTRSRPDYIIRGDSIVSSLCRKEKTLITGTEEGNIRLYDTEIMRPTATWQAHKAQVMCVRSVQGGILSQGREGALSMWRDGQCVKKCCVPCTGFCRFVLSDDNKHCFLGLDEKSKISCIDVETFGVVRTFQPSDYKQKGMCWSVAVEGDYVCLGYESGHLVLFDRRNLSKQVLEVKVHSEIITALAVKDNTVISSSPDATIKITSITRGTSLNTKENASDFIDNSPETEEESQMGTERGEYTAEISHTIPLKCEGSSCIKVRPDGKLFAASGWDGGLRLYSRKKFKLLGLVEAHSPETITDMITFDNRIVCSGRDSKVSFWTFY